MHNNSLRAKMCRDNSVLGGATVNSRKLVHMFFHTLWVGGLAGLLTSFIIKYEEYLAVLSPFQGKELFGVFLFFLGYALVFTVVAQTGFFAYMFVHRYGESIFRSFWPTVQIVVIAFVLFDIVYLTSKELPFLFRLSLMLVILLSGLIVAYFKVRQTNRTAFIPALFLMVVIVTLELSLVLRAADIDFIILMVVPVIVATAYQLFALYHVTKYDPEHERRKAERRQKRLEEMRKRQQEQKNKQNKQK